MLRTLSGACAGLLLLAGVAFAPTSASAAEVTSEIRVSGWVCGGCIGRTEKALSDVKGVKDVDADLDAKVVTVTYDDQITSLAAIEEAITSLKYKVEK